MRRRSLKKRCPAFVEMIEKHFPKLVPLISHTASPMVLTVRYIKAQHPDSKVVFIGPCVAKKIEIQKAQDTADYVMTFEELQALFNAKEINVLEEAENEQDGSRAGKGFAQSGGVSGAVVQALEEESFDLPFSCVKCNGAAECKKTLMILNAGRLEEDFVEGMACEGGCVAGPGGVEEMQKLLKNRSRLMAAADNRGIIENIRDIHDFSKIKMDTNSPE